MPLRGGTDGPEAPHPHLSRQSPPVSLKASCSEDQLTSSLAPVALPRPWAMWLSQRSTSSFFMCEAKHSPGESSAATRLPFLTATVTDQDTELVLILREEISVAKQ